MKRKEREKEKRKKESKAMTRNKLVLRKMKSN